MPLVVLSTSVYIVKKINRKIFKQGTDCFKMHTGMHSLEGKKGVNKTGKRIIQAFSIRLVGLLYLGQPRKDWLSEIHQVSFR